MGRRRPTPAPWRLVVDRLVERAPRPHTDWNLYPLIVFDLLSCGHTVPGWNDRHRRRCRQCRDANRR